MFEFYSNSDNSELAKIILIIVLDKILDFHFVYVLLLLIIITILILLIITILILFFFLSFLISQVLFLVLTRRLQLFKFKVLANNKFQGVAENYYAKRLAFCYYVRLQTEQFPEMDKNSFYLNSLVVYFVEFIVSIAIYTF